MEIGVWLRGLGLERYEPAFRDNAIDVEVLPELTEADLEKLGVLLGHRKRMLRAIDELRTGPLPAPPAPERAADPAERRQLTVMFCDLVGSTALSSRLDPEDLREVIAAYHRAVAEMVAGFDGFVAKYMGDGVLVYFGYPQAHEDDAERAVRAGLAVIEAVGRLDVGSAKLQARVGIATGLVVVGDLIGGGSAQEQSVVGETPNLAARLQSEAAADAVVIAAGTRRLVGDLFEFRDLGTVEVKGIAGPVSAWQVLRPSVVASRFEALRGSGLTRLVGRDEEIDLLLRRWARAKTSDGQIVLISGEAGLGKSRIAAALAERLHAEPHLRLRYFCSPYHQDSALYPFIDQLGRASEFARDDTPASRLKKLEALLARAAPPDEDVAFLADLMSLPASERHPLPNLSPQRKKERILEALIHQLEGLARHQPVVVVFEDAHWIDPTSRELLDLAVECARRLPVLLIITFRPEFQPPWTGQPQVTMLALNRLDRRDRTALAAQIAGGKTLPDAVIDQIADRTDGVPLFVEEVTKHVLESGLLREEVDRYVLDGTLPPFAIPTSLHDSLMARLDRLASVRLVAQTGAAIGREFSYALLRAVSRLPDDELQSALARLVASELVFQRGTPPDAVYTFKHALVQDAAHGSLLRATRQRLHAEIAEALETHSPETAETQPELLAHHYTEAGDIIRAVEYWCRAGERATRRSADREAVAQLRTTLGLVQQLADPAERAAWELRASIALGPALVNIMTPTAPEVARVYARSRELARETGRSVELFQALWGSWQIGSAASDSGNAGALIDELFVLAREEGNEELMLQAHHAAWTTSFVKGDLRAAQRSIEAGIPLYRPDEYQHHALLYGGHDPGVCGHGSAGMIGALYGKPDRALLDANKALSLARGLSHRGSLAHAYWFACETHYMRRDAAAVCDLAGEMLSLAADVGGPLTIMNAKIFRGWGLAARGRGEDGLADLRDGLSDWRRIGSKFHGPYRLARVADGLLLTGDINGALELLAEAVVMAEQTGEHWSDAELDRLAGTAKLRKSTPFFDPQKAEQHLRRAVDGARGNGTRLIELRAAMSLARLWGEEGRHSDARDLLAPIYAWFTEGFDTPDLVEAKALLAELA